MKSILYSIPDKYFPGDKPVGAMAKIYYKMVGRRVVLHDIQVSFTTMRHLYYSSNLEYAIEKYVQDHEDAKRGKTMVNQLADHVFGAVKTT